MAFQPQVNQELVIDGVTHTIAEHPMAPGLPYGQEGRMATVYKLRANGRYYALKVFKAMHRLPAIVGQAEQLGGYSTIPSLEVCKRTVLQPKRHKKLLQEEPDLTYAVLMPWVEGLTWMDLLTGGDELTPKQCRAMAGRFLRVMAGLERGGVAHCDLSGANLLIDHVDDEPVLYLVDVEQLYGPGLDKPSMFLVGTPGYSHQRDQDALWGPLADRFSGAIMLSEMLGWCDPTVQEHTWGESYFDPDEMHHPAERFEVLYAALERYWGQEIATMFSQAWQSKTLNDCAAFNEWLVAFPSGYTTEIQTAPPTETATEQVETQIEVEDVTTILDRAVRQEAQGNFDEAMTLYKKAQTLVAGDETTKKTIISRINQLSLKQITQLSETEIESSPPTQPARTQQPTKKRAVPEKKPEPAAKPAPPEPAAAAPFQPSIVKEYVPATNEAKKYGGLTRGQFSIVLILFPFVAAGVMLAAAQLLRDTPVWENITIVALLGPAIYVALRRKWLTFIVFMPIALIGAVGVSAFSLGSIFFLVLLSGIVLEVMTQIGARLIKEPFKRWPLDLGWLSLTGLLCALILEESKAPGISVLSDPIFLASHLVLAAVGWVIGRYLYQVIIYLREQTN